MEPEKSETMVRPTFDNKPILEMDVCFVVKQLMNLLYEKKSSEIISTYDRFVTTGINLGLANIYMKNKKSLKEEKKWGNSAIRASSTKCCEDEDTNVSS